MPTGNPNLTDQPAFYVAISRARDSAVLVTDDACKLAGQLAGQLERAPTGERLAVLDATVKQAASGRPCSAANPATSGSAST